MTSRARRLGALAATLIVIAGCGDDDSATDSTEAVTTEAGGDPAPTDSEGPTTEGPTTEGPTTEGPATDPASTDAESTATTGPAPSAAPATTAAESDASGTDCPAEQQGGEITIGMNIEPRTFDPTLGDSTSGYGAQARFNVFDSLMRYDPSTGEYVPQMAEALESNDDATEWTLTLRDGVEFANGNPVTTEAVELSISRHAAPDSASLWKVATLLVTEMELVDDLHMVFHLSAPYGEFPALLAGSPGMVYDPIAFAEVGAEAFAADPGAATAGPFTIDYYKTGEPIVAVRNDNYWGGVPCLDQITFAAVPDDAARLDSLRLGELAAAVIMKQPDVDALRDEGFLAPTNPVSGSDLLILNHGAGGGGWATEDLRVRQAIAAAIDPAVIDERFNDGQGSPSSTFVSPRSLLYTGALEGPAYDPELAAELVTEAKAAGFDGQLTIVCNTIPKNIDLAVTLEGLLEAVGFEVELDNQMTNPDSITRFYQGNYELTCSSQNLEDGRPWVNLLSRVGESAVEGSRTGYVSEAMHAALDELRAARTLAERQQAIAGIQEVWNAEIPHVIEAHNEWTTMYNPDVLQGVVDAASGNILLADAYLA